MAYLGNRPDAFQYTSTSYQQLSGDGVTTTFTLSRQVSANGDIEVVVNNVPQEPGVAYYVSDLINLNFTAAPSAAANNIYIVYRSYVQSGIAPAANTVTTSAIAANTIQPWQLTNSLLNPIVNTFTANGTGTTYTLAFTPPSANAVVVTINGITQNHPENYSTNGTTLTFTDAPAANSVVRVLQQAVIGTSIVPIDGSVTTSKLASGLTLSGTTTLTGNLTVAGTTTLSGGVNIDSNTLVVDNVNNRVGINKASPTAALDITGSTLTSGAHFVSNESGLWMNGLSGFGSGITSDSVGTAVRLWTNSTERMRIDSSGNVGIGTNSPNALLNISNGSVVGNAFTIDIGNAVKGYFGGHASNNGGFYINSNQANQDLRFRTQGNDRVTINSSGNVGIGITNPQYTLDVEGTVRIGTGGSIQPILSRSGVSGGLIINTTAASAAGPLIVQDNGTERMRIDSSGNVGIGTSSPSFGLVVEKNNGSGYVAAFRSNNTSPYLTIQTTGGITQLQGLNSTSTDVANIAMQPSGGNVGIGTSLPTARLEVFNSSPAIIRLSRDAGNDRGYLEFGRNNSGSFQITGQIASSSDSTSVNNGVMLFSTSNSSGTLTERARFNSTGAFILAGGTAAASGVGITFPATQSASSDANTLDDYEEGTWTPTYFGASTAGTTTYTGQKGLYVKIGRTVYCECDLAWSARTGTGDGLIGGLPFTTNAYATDARALFYIGAYSGYSITGTLSGIVQASATHIILYSNNNGSLAGSPMQNNGEVRFQFYYIASN